MRLNDKVYDCLKWIVIIVLPALSTLYFTVAKIWGLPYEAEIPATINAVDLFLGALIGISHATIKAEKAKIEDDKEEA